MTDTKWQAPELCQSCIWFCPWNGQGYGCAHKEVHGLLGGVVRCGGTHYKQWQQWVMPNNQEIP